MSQKRINYLTHSPTLKHIYCLIIFCLLSTYSFTSFANANKQVSLAKVYQGHEDLSLYLLSEKYDGVRAYWNGQGLFTRTGRPIHAPSWFTKKLPKIALDGELWMAYGQFEYVSATIRRKKVNNKAWQTIKFMVFDLPNTKQNFAKRTKQLDKIISELKLKHVHYVKQRPIKNHSALINKLDEIIAKGGEGLMLQLKSAQYKQGRSANLLKVKPYLDDEALVLEHYKGKGKYTNMMGAILVENKQGIRFKIGSGFSDEQRRFPPKIGSQISYRYTSLTNKGVPRFARFLRERPLEHK